ncbi:MAG: phosphoribosylaminoimidazolesuccinocarboxamide synthase [Candidatus Levybacteria bacterium]|nr:phosphoribosylaminoimidazolesuccinocarboxamide synthase [Candidatus Levybacteria bacterium]
MSKNNQSEKVDVVDENLKILYKTTKKSAHKKGLLHKTVIAQVRDSKGRYILTRQAPDRQDPGQYVSPVGGHVRAEESDEQALKREAMEELGISDFRYKYVGKQIFHRKILGRDENHYFVCFEIHSDQRPKLNHESVGFKKFTKSELKKKLKENSNYFGAAFLACPPVMYSGLVGCPKVGSRKLKTIKTINLKGFGKKYSGKVRDCYIVGDKRILATTDRISAFDVILGLIPGKGAVLNQLSAFWFEKTRDIIPNHLISTPHPNISIVKSAKLIPIEMVVRGYISGVTNTSIWGSYEKGERLIYGVKFPNGLKKNQKLPEPVITPTTKAESGHDERLTEKEIIVRKTVTPKVWRQMKKTALELFERGTKICAKAGIILVDTKYEFGLDSNGKLMLIDEIHTPDSSRFWIKKTYGQRFAKGLEPENFDKEFLRLWYAKRGYRGNGKPPKMPQNLAKAVSRRYKQIYKKITGRKLQFSNEISSSQLKLLLDKAA